MICIVLFLLPWSQIRSKHGVWSGDKLVLCECWILLRLKGYVSKMMVRHALWWSWMLGNGEMTIGLLSYMSLRCICLDGCVKLQGRMYLESIAQEENYVALMEEEPKKKEKKKECVWYGLDSGHVQLRFETSLLRSIEVLQLQGTMERGSPLKTLIVAVRKDMIDNGVTPTIFVWTSWCTGLFKDAVICLCLSYMVVYHFSSLESFCCPLLLLSLLYCTFECININWAQLSLLMSMTIVFPILF